MGRRRKGFRRRAEHRLPSSNPKHAYSPSLN
jgi:hypothetical protein